MTSFNLIKAGERNTQISRWLSVIFRIIVGGFFFVSGLLKLVNNAQFKEALLTYEIFSGGMITIIGFLLPLIEMTVGLLFVFGFNTAILGKLIICMLVVFTLTATIALSSNQPVDCGCFPVAGGSETSGFGLFIRNGALILLSIYVVAESNKKV